MNETQKEVNAMHEDTKKMHTKIFVNDWKQRKYSLIERKSTNLFLKQSLFECNKGIQWETSNLFVRIQMYWLLFKCFMISIGILLHSDMSQSTAPVVLER